MSAPFLTLLAVAAIAVVFVLVPVAAETFAAYRRHRVVRCPETGLAADIQIDAGHAALTSVPGPPKLQIRECSLWPERAGCAQFCLARPA